jgi:uncharacterized protein YdeI (YjbR/CyaY-like superfamily)
MKLLFFPHQNDFREWLIQNHDKATELVVGFYKVDSGKDSLTWSESVDQALCFGWIDGVRKSIDKESYCIRFTPRKENSIWSAVNINKVEELAQNGLMQAAGLAIYEKRRESKSKIYSYEKSGMEFSAAFEKQFRANTKAWEYFEALAPSYRKASINWVMSAKQESTQIKRLEQLINESQRSTNQWKDSKYNKK